MVRRGLRLGPACLSPGNDGRDSLDDETETKNMRLSARVSFMFRYPLDIFPMEETNIHLRILWLDAKIWVLDNNPKYMLKRLNHIHEYLSSHENEGQFYFKRDLMIGKVCYTA